MEFEPFSPAHGIGLLLAAAIVIGIIGFRRKLRMADLNRTVRIGLALFLVSCEAALYIWYAVTDNWGLHSLPFQLCSIMMWLSAGLLLTRNRKLYEVTFFIGILGAVQALLTPNLDAAFPQFRFFHFFLAHGAIIGASVFFTAVEGYRPRISSVFKAIAWLHILAVPAAVTNYFTGSNFMFLARKPDTASMLDLLAPWPWYLLQLEIVTLVLCGLLLSIVHVADRLFSMRRSSSTMEAD